MTITLFDETNHVIKTIKKVKIFLFHSFGDLLITFKDWSEIVVKKQEYSYFTTEE